MEGLTVTANYSNAASEQVTDYTVDYSAFDPTLLDVEQQIPVTYTHAGLSATAYFPVIVYGYPVVTVDAGDYNGGWTTGDVTLTLSATHPMDGLTYSYYTDSDSTWRTIEGDTLVINTNSSDTYYFKAVNSVGMESAVTEPITVQRDDVTPSFTLTPAVQELTNMSYLVSVENVNVGPSGIQSVTLNGEPITDSYATFRVDQNGEYTVVMTANNGLSSSQTLTVENIDKEVPTVTEVTVEHKNSGGFARFLNDLTFGLFFNEEVELTAAAEDTGVAGLDRIEYRFYDDETETYSEWQVYDDASKPTQLPDFRGYAEVRAYDRAGNVSAVYTSDGYVVDGTAPTDLQVTALVNDEVYTDSTWVADDVTITLESTAFSGIYEYQYRMDGGDWQTLAGSTLTVTESGAHTYEFTAVSNTGAQSAASEAFTVQIDGEKPFLQVGVTGTVNAQTASPVTFTLYVPNSLSGVTYFYTTGGAWEQLESNTLTLTEEMKATFRFKAVNAAGKESYESPVYAVHIEKEELKLIVPKEDGSTTIVVDRSGTTALLTGMTADTTVEALRAQLQNEETQIRVLRNGVELSDGELVGTGCVVQCVSVNDPQTVYESVTVLLMGDVDGDGAITQADYSAVSKAMFNPSAIADGVYSLAADLNGDTVIDGFDLAQFDLVRSMSAAQA